MKPCLPGVFCLAATTFGRCLIGAICVICASVLDPLIANTYTVTSTVDHPITGSGVSINNANGVISGGSGNGLVTLRSAVSAANNIAGPHTINVPAGTYTLTIPGTGEGL